jgi:agmatinase
MAKRSKPPERAESSESASPERLRRLADLADAPLQTQPAYAAAESFFGLPRVGDTDRASRVDVMLTGLPYDGGALARPGARAAPRAIREASLGLGTYSEALGIDVRDEIRAADGGDLVLPGDADRALHLVSRRAEELARTGIVGGFVGGDQSVTLAVLRGIQRAKLKSLALLHFDARTDLLGPAGGRELHQHSAIRVALEEGLLRSAGVLQIGIRGPHGSERELSLAVAGGFELVKTDDVKWDLHAAVSQVRKLVRGGSLYVSVDLSVLDPACAPGVSAPRPGGLGTWELQQLLRALVGAQIVGFDVVELVPTYDTGGVTALVAAGVIHEILAVIADTQRSARPAPSSAGRRRGNRVSP